ncbi:MAG: enoyl-CoA hydratase/isomerase family protein [Alphaproteobacteria bacterium]|nr:enoyl-CoA hydratase/isomerase family protein [Alphaproteobacteria bacterium]
MSKAFETIQTTRDGAVAICELHRPERLNAINRRMLAELQAYLDQVEADEQVRVVVLSGAGRAFCSGFDLKDDASAGTKGVLGWREILQQDFDMLIRWWQLSKPTIAAVHGYCIAGGMEMAMCCDVTVASSDTFFGEPELRFGTVITAMMMPWLVGPKVAKELLLTGNDRISAERALQVGLINQVVPQGHHLTRALELAQQMARIDPAAARLTKQAINRSFEIMGMREALRASLDLAVQIESIETLERREFQEITRRKGLKAAIAWRDARFGQPTTGPKSGAEE